eukprot:g11761.t1
MLNTELGGVVVGRQVSVAYVARAETVTERGAALPTRFRNSGNYERCSASLPASGKTLPTSTRPISAEIESAPMRTSHGHSRSLPPPRSWRRTGSRIVGRRRPPVADGQENLQIWLRVESQSERVTWFLQPLAGVIRLEEPHCEAGADPIFISDIIGVAGRVEMRPGSDDWLMDCCEDLSEVRGGAGLLMTPEATAQTFHPRRDRREESKQPPGQVPWQTFCGASTVLASLPSLSDALLLLDFNTWSRVGPLQPVGLACDDHHNSMVIAERFAVHEVSIPSAGSASTLLPSHLEKCLAEHPGFHADGLTGVRMTCSGESCHAILSGAENISLVCPLGVAKGCPPFLTSDTGSLPRGCELGLLSGFDPAMAEDSQGSLFLPKRPTVTLGDQGLLGAQLALRLLEPQSHIAESGQNGVGVA